MTAINSIATNDLERTSNGVVSGSGTRGRCGRCPRSIRLRLCLRLGAFSSLGGFGVLSGGGEAAWVRSAGAAATGPEASSGSRIRTGALAPSYSIDFFSDEAGAALAASESILRFTSLMRRSHRKEEMQSCYRYRLG